MPSQFAPKSAALVANTQTTLSWGNAEFSSTLGQDNGIIKAPISIGFQVTNTTPQVCYIGIAYTTVTNSYNVNGGKSIAAIPAGASLAINARSVPELGVIGPNTTSITMTLISAGAGTVTVNLIADVPQVYSGGSGQLFGLDIRSNQDYIFSMLPANGIPTVTAGGSYTEQYTCPFGKRAILTSFSYSLRPTALGPGTSVVQIKVQDANNPGGTVIFRVDSDIESEVNGQISSEFFILESTATVTAFVQLQFFNFYTTLTNAKMSAVLTIKEVF